MSTEGSVLTALPNSRIGGSPPHGVIETSPDISAFEALISEGFDAIAGNPL